MALLAVVTGSYAREQAMERTQTVTIWQPSCRAIWHGAMPNRSYAPAFLGAEGATG
jgi:hypothetical protein